MNIILLQDWAVVGASKDPYTAPELIRHSLSGYVFNHPKLMDGSFIVTSFIVGKNGETVLTYSGSQYMLGNPAPAYEEHYPNAKERLLNSLR